MRLPGVTLKNRPRVGSILWYSRSMLCSQGSSHFNFSAAINVSSNHFFVIQSTPPMSDSEFCCSASRTKPQFSRSQFVSALLFRRRLCASSWNCHWTSSAPMVVPFSSRTIHFWLTSREMSRVLCTASAKTRLRGNAFSSSNDKTQAVVPILRAVAYGLMLESPMSK